MADERDLLIQQFREGPMPADASRLLRMMAAIAPPAIPADVKDLGDEKLRIVLAGNIAVRNWIIMFTERYEKDGIQFTKPA